MTPDTLVDVWVSAVSYTGGTVALGRGETPDGELVEFAGEPRALHAISEALDSGEPAVLASVASWSIVRRTPAAT